MRYVYFSGRSGIGKTHLSTKLHEAITPSTYFPLDGYIKYDRKFRESENISSVEPSSYNLSQYQSDLEALRLGQTVVIPTYDHTTGCYGEPLKLLPSELIIIDGLHSFVGSKYPCKSLSIFIDQTLASWKRQKIKRDIQERQVHEIYSLEQIEMNLAIEPTFSEYKSIADIVLHSYASGSDWSYLVSSQNPKTLSLDNTLYDEKSLLMMLQQSIDRFV